MKDFLRSLSQRKIQRMLSSELNFGSCESDTPSASREFELRLYFLEQGPFQKTTAT